MTKLTVRPIEPDDYAQWRPLWDGYNAFYGRSEAMALSEAVTDALWQRFFDEGVPVNALVAELNGRLAGLAHILFHLSTSATEPSAYLQDLFTAPEARGRGVGRALIAAAKQAAEAAGTHRLYWHTHESNRTAQQLYDRLATKTGFIVYRM